MAPSLVDQTRDQIGFAEVTSQPRGHETSRALFDQRIFNRRPNGIEAWMRSDADHPDNAYILIDGSALLAPDDRILSKPLAPIHRRNPKSRETDVVIELGDRRPDIGQKLCYFGRQVIYRTFLRRGQSHPSAPGSPGAVARSSGHRGRHLQPTNQPARGRETASDSGLAASPVDGVDLPSLGIGRGQSSGTSPPPGPPPARSIPGAVVSTAGVLASVPGIAPDACTAPASKGHGVRVAQSLNVGLA